MSTKPDRTLRSMLLQFKRPLLWVGFFSAVANLLSLTPTLYMLQVYDRIMISQNEITLIVLSLLVLLFFMVMTLAEWLRSRLLVRLGAPQLVPPEWVLLLLVGLLFAWGFSSRNPEAPVEQASP